MPAGSPSPDATSGDHRLPSGVNHANLTGVSERIEIADYDPAWPELAAAARAELIAACPGLFEELEHIGSTAVPGLAAKPVIDLMAAVREYERDWLDDQGSAWWRAIEGLGYQHLDTGMSGRLFFFRVTDGRRYHLHLVPRAGWAERNERLLRDWLRAHAADAQAYAALKRTLADRGYAGATYTRAKTRLIQEFVDRAREARGLPPVAVWET